MRDDLGSKKSFSSPNDAAHIKTPLVDHAKIMNGSKVVSSIALPHRDIKPIADKHEPLIPVIEAVVDTNPDAEKQIIDKTEFNEIVRPNIEPIADVTVFVLPKALSTIIDTTDELPGIVTTETEANNDEVHINPAQKSIELTIVLQEQIQYPELPEAELPIIEAINEVIESSAYDIDSDIATEISMSLIDLDFEQSRKVEETFVKLDVCLALIAKNENSNLEIDQELQATFEELVDVLADLLGVDINDESKRAQFKVVVMELVTHALPTEYKATFKDKGTHEHLTDDHMLFKNAAQTLFDHSIPLHTCLGRYLIRLATV